MKRGTPEHPKMSALMDALRCSRATAVGLLELLWHFTGRYAPRGDLGRWPDQRIAEAISWEGEPAIIIRVLVQTGWLDACRENRLVVHDWKDHADDTTKKYLTRKGLEFAVAVSGHCPDMGAGHVRLPLPLPVPIPEPVASAEGSAGPRFPAEGSTERPLTYPLPPDMETEKALREARWRDERLLLVAVGQIAKRTGDEPGKVMEQVTAYRRKDGTVAQGRKDPALLRSHEAVEKSLEDARAWLAALDKEAAS